MKQIDAISLLQTDNKFSDLSNLQFRIIIRAKKYENISRFAPHGLGSSTGHEMPITLKVEWGFVYLGGWAQMGWQTELNTPSITSGIIIGKKTGSKFVKKLSFLNNGLSTAVFLIKKV